MKTKALSFLLIMCMVFSLIVTAGATSITNVTDIPEVPNQELSSEVSETPLPDQLESVSDPYWTPPGEDTSSSELIPNQPRATYGPYTNVQTIPATAMGIVLSSMQNKFGTSIYGQNYAGVSCYEFKNTTGTVYIQTSAFYKAVSGSNFPNAGSVSSSLTSNVNNKNTGYVYSTYSTSNEIDSAYYWDFIMTGSRIFRYENDEIVLENKVFNSVHLTAYFDSLLINSSPAFGPKPTMGLSITNTGSNNMYFGGYQVYGKGADTSVSDISTWISLGYDSATLIGSIATTSLTPSNFYKLFKVALSLNKQISGSLKTYTTPLENLSNPDENIYSYSCSMPAPFVLKTVDCYYQMKIGCIGYPTSATKYNAVIAFGY